MPGFNLGNCPDSTVGPAYTVESSRRHRYILQVLKPLTRDLLIVSHKCGRPTPEIDRIIMHQGQDEIYMPGKNRWLPIDISFYDVHDSGTSNASQEIYDWWSAAVLLIKQSALNRKFKRDGVLQLTDSAGRPVWEYKLLGTWPSKIAPDTLDYSDNSICEITVTLQMDKCSEITRESPTPYATKPSCDQAFIGTGGFGPIYGGGGVLGIPPGVTGGLNPGGSGGAIKGGGITGGGGVLGTPGG